jgi:hypothetical protein
MVFLDYTITPVTLNGSNTTNLRVVYTATHPCFVMVTIRDGNQPGFNAGGIFGFNSAYTQHLYSGDSSYTKGTDCFQVPAYVYPGDNVIFDTKDDDYSGIVDVHVFKLPTEPL